MFFYIFSAGASNMGLVFRKQVKCLNNFTNNLDNNPFAMLKITSCVFRKLAPVTRVTKYAKGAGT